jgi:glucose/arabinose dehydrogenase
MLLVLAFALTPVALALPASAADPKPKPGQPGGSKAAAGAARPVEGIKLPAGFEITMYCDRIPGARSMALSPAGVLLVGTRDDGKVYAVVDSNADNVADQVKVVAQGLNQPNGVAVRDGALYVAEINRILRYDNIDSQLTKPPKPVVAFDKLPSDSHHGQKYIAFGPDGWLYVPVGAPCNICLKKDPRYASLMRVNLKTGDHEVFAHGIRNTVGFSWHPQTNNLWFTDNGRDWLGDNSPPDELNEAPKAGMHFGFPFCHAGTISDPEFGKGHPCKNYTPPAVKLGPHVAALGMKFYSGSMFPPAYKNQIFIAEHGSWNRTAPIGYRVMLVKLAANQAPTYEVFAEGWLRKGFLGESRPVGRPVDVLVMPDGALLISDDHAGAIYRISYKAPQAK